MPYLRDHLIGNADKKPQKDILSDYEEVPTVSLVASKWVADYYIQLGRPTSPFTENGEKMMNILISTWEELYPQDSKDWYAERKDYKNAEMSISEQVHRQTGRSIASYPYPIFQMIRKLFTSVNLSDRKTNFKMVKKFPIFRFANKL